MCNWARTWVKVWEGWRLVNSYIPLLSSDCLHGCRLKATYSGTGLKVYNDELWLNLELVSCMCQFLLLYSNLAHPIQGRRRGNIESLSMKSTPGRNSSRSFCIILHRIFQLCVTRHWHLQNGLLPDLAIEVIHILDTINSLLCVNSKINSCIR